MNTIELQNNIIKHILNLKNTALLEYLNNAISKDETFVEIPDFEKKMLDKNDQDYKNGNVISNKDVRKEISGRLEE